MIICRNQHYEHHQHRHQMMEKHGKYSEHAFIAHPSNSATDKQSYANKPKEQQQQQKKNYREKHILINTIRVDNEALVLI